MWCAEQVVRPPLCDRLHPTTWDAAAYGFEFWALVALFGLLLAGMVAYLAWNSRLAYLGGRFVVACGSYAAAARHLADIEADNEARLAGALSIHAFTKDPKK